MFIHVYHDLLHISAYHHPNISRLSSMDPNFGCIVSQSLETVSPRLAATGMVASMKKDEETVVFMLEAARRHAV